jgi:hypothetical protein
MSEDGSNCSSVTTVTTFQTTQHHNQHLYNSQLYSLEVGEQSLHLLPLTSPLPPLSCGLSLNRACICFPLLHHFLHFHVGCLSTEPPHPCLPETTSPEFHHVHLSYLCSHLALSLPFGCFPFTFMFETLLLPESQ